MGQTRKKAVIPNKWRGMEMDRNGRAQEATDPIALNSKEEEGQTQDKKRNDETSREKIEEVVAHSLMFPKTFL